MKSKTGKSQKKEKKIKKNKVRKERKEERRARKNAGVVKRCCQSNTSPAALTSRGASGGFSCPRETQFVFLCRLVKIILSYFCQCLLLPNAATALASRKSLISFGSIQDMKFGRLKITTDVSSEECNPIPQLRDSVPPCSGNTLCAFLEVRPTNPVSRLYFGITGPYQNEQGGPGLRRTFSVSQHNDDTKFTV